MSDKRLHFNCNCPEITEDGPTPGLPKSERLYGCQSLEPFQSFFSGDLRYGLRWLAVTMIAHSWRYPHTLTEASKPIRLSNIQYFSFRKKHDLKWLDYKYLLQFTVSHYGTPSCLCTWSWRSPPSVSWSHTICKGKGNNGLSTGFSCLPTSSGAKPCLLVWESNRLWLLRMFSWEIQYRGTYSLVVSALLGVRRSTAWKNASFHPLAGLQVVICKRFCRDTESWWINSD